MKDDSYEYCTHVPWSAWEDEKMQLLQPLHRHMMQTGTNPGGKNRENHIQIRSLSGFYNKLIQSPIFLGARCYAVATSPSWGRGHCAHSSLTDITIESYGENLAVELRKRPVSSWVWGFLLSNLITVQKSPVFLLNGCCKLLKIQCFPASTLTPIWPVVSSKPAFPCLRRDALTTWQTCLGMDWNHQPHHLLVEICSAILYYCRGRY